MSVGVRRTSILEPAFNQLERGIYCSAQCPLETHIRSSSVYFVYPQRRKLDATAVAEYK